MKSECRMTYIAKKAQREANVEMLGVREGIYKRIIIEGKVGEESSKDEDVGYSSADKAKHGA